FLRDRNRGRDVARLENDVDTLNTLCHDGHILRETLVVACLLDGEFVFARRQADNAVKPCLATCHFLSFSGFRIFKNDSGAGHEAAIHVGYRSLDARSELSVRRDHCGHNKKSAHTYADNAEDNSRHCGPPPEADRSCKLFAKKSGDRTGRLGTDLRQAYSITAGPNSNTGYLHMKSFLFVAPI